MKKEIYTYRKFVYLIPRYTTFNSKTLLKKGNDELNDNLQ